MMSNEMIRTKLEVFNVNEQVNIIDKIDKRNRRNK